MAVDPSPSPVSAARWRRRGKRVVITLGVTLMLIVVLCCAGVSYVVYDGYRAPREEKAIGAFAEDLCEALVAGDTDAVYVMLGAGARERYSGEELARGLAARARLTRCDVLHASYLFLLGSYVMIETSNGRHTFDLVKEAGEWKVDSDILDDLNSPPSHGGGGGGFDD